MKGKQSFIHYNNNMLSVGGDMISTANCCYNGNSTEDGNGNVNGNKNGMRSMYLFPGGYCNLNDPTVTGTDSISYHYYNKDHLGNNREVINEQGHIEQVVHYYPFGTPFTDGSSTNIGLQPYLYGNKELDMMHGLNTYDFGARNFNPLLPMWDRMDRYCEKYYDVNPYMYCKDNPISYTDSNGDTIQVREFDNDKKAWVVYSYDIGNSQFVDANGNAYSGSNDIIIKTSSALSTLCKGSAGKALVSFLSESSEKVLITQKDGRGNSEGGDSEGYKSYIYWNPDKDAMFGGGSFIALGHELAHSYDRINGTLDKKTWFNTFNSEGIFTKIAKAEIFAMHYENLIRAEHGVNLRTHYTKDVNGRPYSGQVIKENNMSIYFNSQGNHLPRYKRIKSGNYIY